MALTKEQKAAIVEEVTGRLENALGVYLTDFKGLSVDKVNELRGRFREAGVEFKVVKNTLLRRAMQDIGGYDDLFEHLNGPTAVAISAEPAAPARVIKEFLKDNDLPELKVAYIDGAIYPGDQLDALASLKSKDELIGDIVGLLMAPMSNVVSGLQAQGSNLVGAIKTIAEKDEA